MPKIRQRPDTTGLGVLASNQYARKYRWDRDYFRDINTEQKAYWLGLCFGDGGLRPRKGTTAFGICLRESDSYLLRQFAADVRFTGNFYREPGSTNNAENTIGFRVFGETELSALVALMGTGRKITRRVPELRTDLERHFWRGLFDADGSVSAWRNTFMVTVCHASESVMQAIQWALYRNDICRGNYFRHAGTWQMSTSGAGTAMRLANWLYADATRCLDRKIRVFAQAWNGASVGKRRTLYPCLLPSLGRGPGVVS